MYIAEGIHWEPLKSKYVFNFESDEPGDFIHLQWRGVNHTKIGNNDIFYGFGFVPAKTALGKQQTASADQIAVLKHEAEQSPSKRAIDKLTDILDRWPLKSFNTADFTLKKNFIDAIAANLAKNKWNILAKQFAADLKRIAIGPALKSVYGTNEMIGTIIPKAPEDLRDIAKQALAPMIAAATEKQQELKDRLDNIRTTDKTNETDYNRHATKLVETIRQQRASETEVAQFIELAANNFVMRSSDYGVIIIPSSTSQLTAQLANRIGKKLGVPVTVGFEKNPDFTFDVNEFKQDGYAIEKAWINQYQKLSDYLNERQGKKGVSKTGMFPHMRKYFKNTLSIKSGIVAPNKPVLVVDDIIHSGSTMTEIIRLLSEYGVDKVDGYALIKLN